MVSTERDLPGITAVPVGLALPARPQGERLSLRRPQPISNESIRSLAPPGAPS